MAKIARQGRGWVGLAGGAAFCLGLLAEVSAAGAVNIVEFQPQGRVSGMQAVQVHFSSAVTAFGDTAAQDPITLECQGPVPEGQGRWLDDKRWTYQFDATVPAGVRCVAKPAQDFRDLQGQPISSDQSYEFDTGAPRVTVIRPYSSSTIDESQIFIVRFDSAVDPSAVAENSHCAVDGLEEQIPVHAVDKTHQSALLDVAYMPLPDDEASIALLQCGRKLPPDTVVRLVVGPGVRALGQPAELAASTDAQAWEFGVRPPFLATVTCTRERAGRPCLPVSPISVQFSAPVPRAMLEGTRLALGDTLFPSEQSRTEDDEFLSYMRFPGPFPPESQLTLSLPAGLQDDAGRALENAARYPMQVAVADYPPLVKFASAEFGVVERFAESKPGSGKEAAAVPVTLRHVEADLKARGASWSAGKVSNLRSIADAQVLAWYSRLRRLESGRWAPDQVQDIMEGRRPRQSDMDWAARQDARGISLLKNQTEAKQMALPAPSAEGQSRPFEVIGVPLSEPGFHVLEIESPRLGAALLADEAPMYVRTGVLLTNLAVHVKQGSDDLLVWVTTLADAQPVKMADISVVDCNGRTLLTGQTDANGVWHHLDAIDAPQFCVDTGLEGLFVSARIPAEHEQAHGKADYSFVMSGWDRGIETWRFNVPTDSGAEPVLLTHTVFDRSLYRAGETVSMKHFLREESRAGLRLPDGQRPNRVLIEHEGSSQVHELALTWQETASGGLTALSEFKIPESAHLGTYSLRLTDADQAWYGRTQFRVEEFRLPLLTGQLSVRDPANVGPLVAPRSLEVSTQLSWLAGGPAMGQQMELSAAAEDRGVRVPGFEDYSFIAPNWWLSKNRKELGLSEMGSDPNFDQMGSDPNFGGDAASPQREVFVDAASFRLDEQGVATLQVDAVPVVDRPRRFVFEAAFADPNGEIQTLSHAVDVWPSEVQVGVQAPAWEQSGKPVLVSLVAVGTDGKPRADIEIQLLSVERKTYSVRKRMVGGFYRYDSHTQRGAAQELCSGSTNEDGVLHCEVSFDQEGSFELVAEAHDDQGRVSRAYTTMWLSGEGDLWFDGADDDRIDLVPVKREWVAGEQAQFQVRMPFREAVALVSVEREGVLWSEVVTLKGNNPIVSVPVSGDWGPNAYVSVLVLRGRLFTLPWQSFFEEGWRNPTNWLQTWKERREVSPPNQWVDLAKPAFRFGLAELKLSGEADRLQVALRADKEVLRTGEETRAHVKVSLPDGSPAAHASVAFIGVDEALLELAPNQSWSLYEAMHPRRSLRVRTASNQMEVVGRRHYGRKAVASGGGGGHLPTRQLFDTLLTWQPEVQLDAKGEAELPFQMNDSLSRFRLVALADYGPAYFGIAQAAVTSSQDIQLVSGLPPVVREGDRYLAALTVRNGSREARRVTVTARQDPNGLNLSEKSVELAPGQAATVAWEVEAPSLVWPREEAQLDWHFQASDGEVGDALKISQHLQPSIPVSTIQATLLGLTADNPVSLPVVAPPSRSQDSGAPPHGGLLLNVSASLVGSLEGVQAWWQSYPYTCLEQSASQALALNDAQRWQNVLGRLITHMDEDGLLRYFPSSAPGSEVLTAYLLSVDAEARRVGLSLTLPDAALKQMLDGLQAFAEGRIHRDPPWALASLEARRIMAMAALARYGRVSAQMLGSIKQTPQYWSTPTLIDWLTILNRMPHSDARRKNIAQVRSILVARMSVSGEAMWFSDAEHNSAPGLMATPVTSLAQLILVGLEDEYWHADIPRMVQGLLSQQKQGAWSITTENLLGVLALNGYSGRFEKHAATGQLQAVLGKQAIQVVLPEPGAAERTQLNWSLTDEPLQLLHQGEGTAWVSLRAQARVSQSQVENAGFRLERRLIPVQQRYAGRWSRGDVYRVELDIYTRESANWVVLNDPIPAGSTILGSGLGRDAPQLTTGSNSPSYPPAFVERGNTSYRAYFDYLPAGKVSVSYTVRLNAVGDFSLPASRIEALYHPDMRGSFPNEHVNVGHGGMDDAETQ